MLAIFAEVKVADRNRVESSTVTLDTISSAEEAENSPTRSVAIPPNSVTSNVRSNILCDLDARRRLILALTMLMGRPK